jgi:predicted nucleotidyltransferase
VSKIIISSGVNRMTADEYLISIADQYHIKNAIDSYTKVNIINPLEKIIKEWAGSCLYDVYLSGSRSKGTAISLSSDFDLFVSLKADTENTLREIYDSLHNYLIYYGLTTRRQNVSIGIHFKGHQIDIVPAKKRPGNTNYHSLYISKQDTWTQTNVVEHANIVKSSGRITEMYFLKYGGNFMD